mmetsp:Transcript_37887/g.95226  ORF Transcript_37887/g.95226 Transcript_37887/m.95226 type:complete len:210 (+) Transcript_37887:124-753(+)|eukprot:CAMPEP_0177633296 /NCGR_PEP_ID=MMETSP0447-20121125/2760_1 /TAXON_ID=0 /ORGANISM="Stygamoeba regulata, Strain BSH-02190019" /LENGTH=209 /DNA_ID=CAMNT_0019134943 /DNA_START=54 /DNA_END=683 /DNA_ORIENTATION=+
MNENLSPAVLKKIQQELRSLLRSPLEDVKLIPCEEDLSTVQAFIYGPKDTPYENGVFKVKLKLGSDFPSVPPKAHFLTKIFHPNVAKNGEICVNTLKRDWKEDLGLRHILLTIKCLLIEPNPESALNEEAGKLLLEDYESYAKHAKLMTKIHASVHPDLKELDKDSEPSSSSLPNSKSPPKSASSKTAGSKQPAKKVATSTARKSMKRL